MYSRRSATKIAVYSVLFGLIAMGMSELEFMELKNLTECFIYTVSFHSSIHLIL